MSNIPFESAPTTTDAEQATTTITLDKVDRLEIREVLDGVGQAAAPYTSITQQLQKIAQEVAQIAQRDPEVVAAEEKRVAVLTGVQEKYGINLSDGQLNLATGEFTYPAPKTA